MRVVPDTKQPQYVIDDLQLDDTDAIDGAAALLVEVFPHWLPTMENARDEVMQALGTDRICLAARTGHQILGWIGANSQYSHAWELHPLVVSENVRGEGVGRALLAALEERVRAEGAMTLFLGADDDGPIPGTSAGGVDLFPDVLSHAAMLAVIDHPAGFYLREGFEVIGLIPDANGPGKPDVLMAKRIGAGS